MSRPATRLASAVLGIALFVASFAVFRLFENPPEGAGALALEVAGWLGMFIAAIFAGLVVAGAVLLILQARRRRVAPASSPSASRVNA